MQQITPKKLRPYGISMIMLSAFTAAHGSFISDFFEEIAELNAFNAHNRQRFYEFLKSSMAQITDPEASTTEDEKVREQIAHAVETFCFKDIAGDIPQDILEIVHFMHHPEYFTRLGAKAPKGVLMYGPPGTGKTSLARAIAGEAGAAFFYACASEFMELYVGVGPQRVRELFEKARKESKAIIFIDELDGIAKKRTATENNDERTRTLAELLNQMDGFAQNGNLLVIAATNRVEDLDAAIKRPGRFDRIVEIPLPNLNSREAIIRLYCSKILYAGPEEFFAVLAGQTQGLSGAELENLVNEAAILAARQKATTVQPEHLVSARKKVLQQKKH